MKSEGSLPCSQEPATGSYLDLVESSPHSHIQFAKNPFQYYHPFYA
jgi:hypothetical protein